MSGLTENQKQWLALWLVPGIGPKRIERLLGRFSGVDLILTVSPRELTQAGLSVELAREVSEALEAPRLQTELSQMEAKGVQLLTRDDPDYSALLKEISDPPPLLYTQGTFDFNRGLHLAFVGSRKASHLGKSLTERLIKRIAQIAPETVIVSGLALGIDGAAHEAALKFGLKTIAVLGNGLNSVYPTKHAQLAKQVVGQGAVLSEFPMSMGPLAQNFPLRNRIVSGLCQGTLVIEAGERSGASITANLALEQGREVFALPGAPDSSFFRGTNKMIQQGRAKLVLEVEDIFEELQWEVRLPQKTVEQKPPELTEQETLVMELLTQGPLHQDRLSQKLNLPIGPLLALLTTLQMKDLVVGRVGGVFERS